MKRRLNLAAALLHDPQILLLDEPTVGVDPAEPRTRSSTTSRRSRRRGKTLVYTTHYMEEAERLCDRVVIIDHGTVVADDTLQGLYRLLPASNVVSDRARGRERDGVAARLRAPGSRAFARGRSRTAC